MLKYRVTWVSENGGSTSWSVKDRHDAYMRWSTASASGSLFAVMIDLESGEVLEWSHNRPHSSLRLSHIEER